MFGATCPPRLGQCQFTAQVGAACACWAHPDSCLGGFHLSAQRQLYKRLGDEPPDHVLAEAEVSEVRHPSARRESISDQKNISILVDPITTSGYVHLPPFGKSPSGCTVSWRYKRRAPRAETGRSAIGRSNVSRARGIMGLRCNCDPIGWRTTSWPGSRPNQSAQATSLNLVFIAPHTGHLSGASPTCVWPQTSQT